MEEAGIHFLGRFCERFVWKSTREVVIFIIGVYLVECCCLHCICMADLTCVVHYPHQSSRLSQAVFEDTEYSHRGSSSTSSVIPLNKQKLEKLLSSKETQKALGGKNEHSWCSEFRFWYSWCTYRVLKFTMASSIKKKKLRTKMTSPWAKRTRRSGEGSQKLFPE